jgi:hypothetical protein
MYYRAMGGPARFRAGLKSPGKIQATKGPSPARYGLPGFRVGSVFLKKKHF